MTKDTITAYIDASKVRYRCTTSHQKYLLQQFITESNYQENFEDEDISDSNIKCNYELNIFQTNYKVSKLDEQQYLWTQIEAQHIFIYIFEYINFDIRRFTSEEEFIKTGERICEKTLPTLYQLETVIKGLVSEKKELYQDLQLLQRLLLRNQVAYKVTIDDTPFLEFTDSNISSYQSFSSKLLNFERVINKYYDQSYLYFLYNQPITYLKKVEHNFSSLNTISRRSIFQFNALQAYLQNKIKKGETLLEPKRLSTQITNLKTSRKNS